ncbi:kinase D-interacting substrate of 220 kDa B-like isoform X3 [Palaemon carinicauda]|uniref:kinase D-interacting substrate of 220 kDa B-like isoform X3 n=1 Tax=Palaemon carinicauda TaxID=392227 RepID=UPI0035B5CCCD
MDNQLCPKVDSSDDEATTPLLGTLHSYFSRVHDLSHNAPNTQSLIIQNPSSTACIRPTVTITPPQPDTTSPPGSTSSTPTTPVLSQSSPVAPPPCDPSSPSQSSSSSQSSPSSPMEPPPNQVSNSSSPSPPTCIFSPAPLSALPPQTTTVTNTTSPSSFSLISTFSISVPLSCPVSVSSRAQTDCLPSTSSPSPTSTSVVITHKQSSKPRTHCQVAPPPMPLLVPSASSGIPVICLRQNTPENSPVVSPAVSPTRSNLPPFPSLTHPASALINSTLTSSTMALLPASEPSPTNTAPRSNDGHPHHHAFTSPTQEADPNDSSDPPDTETGDDDGDDEDTSKSGGCGGLTRHCGAHHRPSLLIPEAPEQHQRRASLLSTLSVSPSICRRPSIASLLSLTPSLAARRFSFNIGGSNSRSDQMVSLSFKSLESYISEDNLPGLQSFLASRSVVIDDKDENGATALIVAAGKGRAEFCNELIVHGADVNAEDNDQWSPLITATKEGHEATVAALLEHGANVDHRDMGGWTALMWASYKGHTSLAKMLLNHKADPNAQGQHHMTSLVWAAGRGHTEIVRDLLAHGAKANIGDKFGTAPLIWACRKGYYEIADDLLKHGANVDASGMYSWTPLLVATRGNYVDLVHLLIEHRPNLNALDKDGGTALTIACKEGYTDIATALLNAGAYVNMQDRNGDTNLIYAARGGHRAVVEALLKKYGDVDVIGKDKKTALYWAVEKGHTAVVKVLLSANPDIEHSTKDGDTALLRAVRTKNAEVVQLLVDKKARVSIADKKGDTVLHIAMRGRSKRIVEILLRNPKNSQLLYRPNRAGETPYNIDLSNQKTILGQIFGARRLNTNEDNENMLGYDLYSSSMADILSEPSLSMPISVGLYAKWGSGKSFLIRKLKEEMGSFARQWVEPLFQFSPLVLLLVTHLALLIGLITAVPTSSWIVGVATGGGVFLILTLFLVAVWHGSRRYDWHVWYRWSVILERQMAALKLVLQVIFCSPPGPQWKEWKDGVQARPLKFIFAEGAKPSSTAAGENSVVQMLGSLFDMVEREYGMFATRFYRAFRPKPQGTSAPWKYRRLCCMPYIVIFFVTLICLVTVIVITGIYGFHAETPLDDELTTMTQPSNNDADMTAEDENSSVESSEDDDYVDTRPFHGHLMNPLLITLGVLVAMVVVANLHTLARMFGSLIFSHRRHLLRAVSKLDTIKAEGYLQTLKAEVNLMVEMVKCLDAFTIQQTRLVVVVDGLDSCEQEKVLSVLDAVHTLFTDSSAPFIILLAIDPHIITKAIELHVHRVFNESSISGHDYLRNIVHLPFYLQNSGLRKVKQAQQAAERSKSRSQNTWLEVETDSVSIATTSAMGGISHIPLKRGLSTESGFSLAIPANRRLSSESGLSTTLNLRRNNSKSSRRTLKPSDSIASSIGSNLNRVGGAQDLTKVLLTDDYFSDINPRSMRRLMNVVYITGRLLKAFNIDFNWYHLASWINITEQWPYRASWLILYYEANEDTLEDKMSLKDLYEKLKHQIPNSKDIEPLLEMDKEEKKFEIFLSMHKSSLHISNLKVFLPFTINLDPFIRKVIKEDQPQFDDAAPHFTANPTNHWSMMSYEVPSKASTTNRRTSFLQPPLRANQKNSTASMPPGMNPLMWGYGPPPHFLPSIQSAPSVDYNVPMSISQPLSTTHAALPAEAADKKLSTLSIEGLFEIFSKVDGVSIGLLPTYKERLIEHNINGKVLLHCNLDDLKQVLHMNFGDWELFRVLVLGLREREADDEYISKNVRFVDPHLSSGHDGVEDTNAPSSLISTSSSSNEGSLVRRGSSRSSSTYSGNKEREESHSSVRKMTKQNLLAKQVTMEEQMIFGALQTLNEEAFEDVVEEQEKVVMPSTPSHLQTIPSVGIDGVDGISEAVNCSDELDVVYIQSSPLAARKVVCAPPSDSESAAPSLASSFSPYRSNNNPSLSRASSLKCSSTSTSPKHSNVEKPLGLRHNNSFRSEKAFSADESRELSPIRRLSASNNSSPLKRDRPRSLNLGHDTLERKSSNPDSSKKDQFDVEDIPQASLPDLPGAVAGMKTISLAEQFSAHSLEKLRRLKHKLHRALGSHDGTVMVPADDAETSPLVLATPPLSTTTPICPSTSTTPELEDPHAVNHYPEIRSRPLTPLVRQNARETSPTPQIICKPQLSSDRETPV